MGHNGLRPFSEGSLWTAVTVMGMLAGILIFGQVADRLGRRPAFWIFQAGAIVNILAYSQFTDPSALLACGFFMGAFTNGMLGGHGTLLADHLPHPIPRYVPHSGAPRPPPRLSSVPGRAVPAPVFVTNCDVT